MPTSLSVLLLGPYIRMGSLVNPSSWMIVLKTVFKLLSSFRGGSLLFSLRVWVNRPRECRLGVLFSW